MRRQRRPYGKKNDAAIDWYASHGPPNEAVRLCEVYIGPRRASNQGRVRSQGVSMCLILIAWRGAAKYPCVVAANRDELYSRPTAAAHWWPSRPPILAGQDLLAGGTWLGLTQTGRFAALTNFRDPEQRRTGTPSRGTLVASILASGDSIERSLEHLCNVSA